MLDRQTLWYTVLGHFSSLLLADTFGLSVLQEDLGINFTAKRNMRSFSLCYVGAKQEEQKNKKRTRYVFMEAGPNTVYKTKKSTAQAKQATQATQAAQAAQAAQEHEQPSACQSMLAADEHAADSLHMKATPHFAAEGMVLSADRRCLIKSLILRKEVVKAEANKCAKANKKSITKTSDTINIKSHQRFPGTQRNRRFFSLLITSRHVFVRHPFSASSYYYHPSAYRTGAILTQQRSAIRL